MTDIGFALVVIFGLVLGFGIGLETYAIFFDKPANAFLNVVHDPDEEKPYMMLDITPEEFQTLDKREYIKLKIRHINMRE